MIKGGLNPIPLPDTDEELLEQCDVWTFRAGGKGGQHVNKTESAVRLRHRISGITTTCQSQRSQYQNKMRCLRNLRAKIENANTIVPERKLTLKSAGVKKKIREEKRLRGAIKTLRNMIKYVSDE